jgi:hypothetical protein
MKPTATLTGIALAAGVCVLLPTTFGLLTNTTTGAPRQAVPEATVQEVSFSGEQHFDLSDDDLTQFEAPHWRDHNLNGRTTDSGDRRYPVAFVSNSTMKVSAKFVLSCSPGSTGSVKVRGNGTNGVTIPATSATIVGNEIDITCVPAEDRFASEVQYFNPLTITWQVSWDGGTTWNDAGRTRNKVYIVLAEPIKSGPSSPIFRTAVHIGCVNAIGKSLDVDVIAGVWAEFCDRIVRRVCDNQILSYYSDYEVGNSDTKGLLLHRDAGCLAWAMFMHDAIRSQGINCSSVVGLSANAADCHGNPQPAGFLVKNWSFGTGSEPLCGFDYLNLWHEPLFLPGVPGHQWLHAEVTDAYGLPGQGTPNPRTDFLYGHTVVKIDGVYYDPSYGEKYSCLQDMQDRAIAGFQLQPSSLAIDESSVGLDLNGNGHVGDIVSANTNHADALRAMVIKPASDELQLGEADAFGRFGTASAPADEPASDIVFGVVDGERAYVSQVTTGKRSRPVDLRTRSLTDVENHLMYVPVLFDLTYRNYPLRWRLGEDRQYWMVGVRELAPLQRGFSLATISLDELAKPGAKKLIEAGIEPLRRAFLAADLRGRKDVYFDILPRGPLECSIFVLAGGLLEVSELKLRTGNETDVPLGWVNKASFDMQWSEPFRVIARDDAWYFATASGAIWSAKRRADADGWQIERIWSGQPDPVRMIVLDSRDGRAIAFTSGKFFEVREPVTPRPAGDIDWDDPDPDAPIKQVVQAYKAVAGQLEQNKK